MRIDLNDAHYIARGRSHDIIEAWAEARTAQNEAIKAFAKEVGATRFVTGFSQSFIGVDFDTEPDAAIWKRVNARGGRYWWAPRLSTKAGKAMQARMDAVKTPKSVLTELGLPAEGMFLVGDRWYTAGLYARLSDSGREWFIVLPFGAHPEYADWYKAPPDAERITFEQFVEFAREYGAKKEVA